MHSIHFLRLVIRSPFFFMVGKGSSNSLANFNGKCFFFICLEINKTYFYFFLIVNPLDQKIFVFSICLNTKYLVFHTHLPLNLNDLIPQKLDSKIKTFFQLTFVLFCFLIDFNCFSAIFKKLMLKIAIKTNYKGGHIAESGQNNGRKKFGAEGA